MFLAKALYDNVAETLDELSFRRGEVVTVLDQDTGGLEGWWLCSLRGARGIAPGNRLKILSGMGEGGGGGRGDQRGDSGQVQPRADWQRTLDKPPSKVMPGSVNEGDLRSLEDYDVPPSRHTPALPCSKEPSPEPGHDIYDTPTSLPLLPHSNSGNSSLYATPSASRRASYERTPPGSQRGSVDSLSSPPSLLPRLSADNGQPPRVYQTLPGSRRASAESGPRRLSAAEQLYETPPGSRRGSADRTLSDDQPLYDTPVPGARAAECPGESAYDTPQPSSRRQSRDSAGGSRGSVMSSASSESGMSGSCSNLSKAPSLPDSARSSMDDTGHDGCDLTCPRERCALTQLSLDSGLGLYDTPAPPSRQPHSPQPPSHFTASLSHSQLSEYGADKRPCVDLKRSRSVEHALDDIYDSPRSNAPRVTLTPEVPPCGARTPALSRDPNAVYDVPPQVTRDSVISARSDSSDDSVRLSSCSSDSRGSGPEYSSGGVGEGEEVLLDLDSALEVLVKRQQDVTRACARVLSFVTANWRSKEFLQSHVLELRAACADLNKALADFTDLAQGAVTNAAHVPDRKVGPRLVKLLGPVQQHRRALSAAVGSLEDLRWRVALLALPVESDCGDPLGAAVAVAHDAVPPVKRMASAIQTNASALFRRSSDLAAQSRGAEDGHVVSKPPAGPKSDPVPKAGRGGGCGVGVVIHRPRSVQQRPLPPPPLPLSERPLPPTPLQQRLRDLEVAGALDSLTDYINLQGRDGRPDDDGDNGDRDYSHLQQDYDYVQIETCDAEAQQRRKALQALNSLEEEPDSPKTPTPDTPPSDDSGNTWRDDGDVTMNAADSVYSDIKVRHPDIDTLPSKESSTSRGHEDEVNEEDLKTPMNKVNGFSIPDHGYSSGYVDVTQTSLCANDKQVLVYYSGQLETHSTLLNNAIDAFFACIENSEPPKVFISNSKFVIVTAHKLVYISDALHRNLSHSAVRHKVMQCANHVCECVKVSVQATKTAALQFPSVPAVQDMVDRVVDVSHAAHELKLVITQAAAL
ncbi:hypothetical protein ACOMHN_044626 [Nucella lapillus]